MWRGSGEKKINLDNANDRGNGDEEKKNLSLAGAAGERNNNHWHFQFIVLHIRGLFYFMIA